MLFQILLLSGVLFQADHVNGNRVLLENLLVRRVVLADSSDFGFVRRVSRLSKILCFEAAYTKNPNIQMVNATSARSHTNPLAAF